MKKKIFAVLALAILLALSMAPAAWAATVASGECGAEGDNVTWVLDDTGTLTISGTGAMADYNGTATPWYKQQDNVKQVVIENGVSYIGDWAFVGCGNLVNINISATVSNIGTTVFPNSGDIFSNINTDVNNLNYSSLNGVLFNKDKTVLVKCPVGKSGNYIIPDTVNTIGVGAFQGCYHLTNIKIPNNVTNIDNVAFYNCESLKQVNLPQGITKISNGTFSACRNLTNIVIPDSVISIDSLAFSHCDSLNNIVIPGSVTNIGEYAFAWCSGLSDVTISNSVNVIEERAFSACTNIKDVYYMATQAEWNKIYIKDGNEPLLNATIHFLDVDEPTVSVTGVTLNQTALNLEVNGTATLQATVAPANATNKSVRWSSNNTSVATVDNNGNVKAVGVGTATINVTTEDGNKTATCEVTVSEKKIPVESVILNKTALTMEVKTSEQLAVSILPEDATDKAVTWTSSDEKVATVDNNGKVTALTKGTAAITVAAGDKKATCAVTVTADKVYSITFDTDGGTLAEGVTNPDYVTKGETYKMPTANKSRYTLTAWAIGAKDSENKVKANDVYTFTEDTTVYAIWQYNGGGGGSHGGSSRPSGTTTKPGTTEKPGDTNKPGTTTDNNKTVTAANVNNKFADVQNNAWYSEAIAYVYNKGMMNGTDAGKFEPNATTTRAMLVTMLFRLEGEPKAGAADFSDVASGQWFSEAIAWAAANGVVNGYKDGTFAPNDMITREQLAAVLYRFAQFKGYDVSVKGSLSNFSDSGSVSDWAQEAMQWAVGAGIINGDNGALKPAGNATRAEVAMMLMRFCENVAK